VVERTCLWPECPVPDSHISRLNDTKCVWELDVLSDVESGHVDRSLTAPAVLTGTRPVGEGGGWRRGPDVSGVGECASAEEGEDFIVAQGLDVKADRSEKLWRRPRRVLNFNGPRMD
jgi:hypothetical protein